MSKTDASRYTANQILGFSVLRVLFGLVWLVNTGLQANGSYLHRFLHSLVARIQGQPAIIQAYLHAVISGVVALGPEHVAIVTVVIDALLALSLLTGIWVRPLAWVGIVYNLFLWSTVGGFGGPYGAGATDPGTAIVYALVFWCVLAVPSDHRLRLVGTPARSPDKRALEGIRVLFGLLWAFDAFWKWQPAFLEHSLSYLTTSEPGQPAWVVLYIATFVRVCGVFGPVAFGVFAAIAETGLALSLLFKRAQQWFLPLGALYSLAVWTTGEGWGGPYALGITGNRGDVLGTANIYVIVYLYLMVAYMMDRYRSRPNA